MEVERNDNVRGIAGAGLGLGIAGTALGLLNGGLGNILGINPVGGVPAAYGAVGIPSESMPVNRYEAAQAARIAALETEVKLRDANTYTIGEIGKLRDYVDARLDGVNAQIGTQAVVNAQVAANLACLQGTVAQLSGLTKLVVPNSSICPGWGDVTVTVTPTTATTG